MKQTRLCALGAHAQCPGKVLWFGHDAVHTGRVTCECPECDHAAPKARLHPDEVRRNYRSSPDQRATFGNRCAICLVPEITNRTWSNLTDMFAWETYSGSIGIICKGNCSKAMGSVRKRMATRQQGAQLLLAAIDYLDGDYEPPCICTRAGFDEPSGALLHSQLQGDHDHSKGVYRTDRNARGLLCAADNTMIGKLKDDPGRLQRAAAMLVGPITWTTPTGARW